MTTTTSPSGEYTPFSALPPHSNKYEILNVARDASMEEIRIAYRRMAMFYHPDRHAEQDRELAGEQFKRIGAAYRTLSDPDERRRYDRALARGEEYRDGRGDPETISLLDILADVNRYEHIFAADRLTTIGSDLRDFIVPNLIGELGEQIIGVWRLSSAPTTHQGTFEHGAIVLTSLRVLLPFTYTWEETQGNKRFKYKGGSVPGVFLPAVEKLVIISDGRVKNTIKVEITTNESTTTFQPGHTNLGKLLLVMRLWGIPVELREPDRRRSELEWALVSPWSVAGIFAVVAFVVAAFIGLFSDGVVQTPINFAYWLHDTGVLQVAVLLVAAISARRSWRWIATYKTTDPATLVATASTQAAAHGSAVART